MMINNNVTMWLQVVDCLLILCHPYNYMYLIWYSQWHASYIWHQFTSNFIICTVHHWFETDIPHQTPMYNCTSNFIIYLNWHPTSDTNYYTSHFIESSIIDLKLTSHTWQHCAFLFYHWIIHHWFEMTSHIWHQLYIQFHWLINNWFEMTSHIWHQCTSNFILIESSIIYLNVTSHIWH